jgi:hypothetical protein
VTAIGSSGAVDSSHRGLILERSPKEQECEMAIAIEWEDGTIDRGPTPESVITLIGETQWDPKTPDEMVRVLSDRAWVRNHDAIDPELTLKEFFAKLAEAGIIRILEWAPEEVLGGGLGQASSKRLSMRQRRERETPQWAEGR